MVGILVQLVLSWLIVWVIEKKDLRVLGWLPTRQRLRDFAVFFLVTAICCLAGYIIHMFFGARWKLNPGYSILDGLKGAWWYMRSVLFEELIFRGVLLYILIKRLGVKPAMILSAVAFGIYHWFSFGVLGNPVQMSIVFLATGMMGILLAYGYVKTFSLYVPVAIHFGWSFVKLLFSDGPIGPQLLVPDKPAFTVTVSWLVANMVLFFPVVLMFILNYLLLKRKPVITYKTGEVSIKKETPV